MGRQIRRDKETEDETEGKERKASNSQSRWVSAQARVEGKGRHGGEFKCPESAGSSAIRASSVDTRRRFVGTRTSDREWNPDLMLILAFFSASLGEVFFNFDSVAFSFSCRQTGRLFRLITVCNSNNTEHSMQISHCRMGHKPFSH